MPALERYDGPSAEVVGRTRSRIRLAGVVVAASILAGVFAASAAGNAAVTLSLGGQLRITVQAVAGSDGNHRMFSGRVIAETRERGLSRKGPRSSSGLLKIEQV